MDIRKLHSKGMKHLMRLVPKSAQVEYENKLIIDVPCTTSRNTIKTTKHDFFVGENILVVNILKDDLIEKQAPLKGFLFLTYNRVKYQVSDITYTGVFENVIRLECKLFKKGNT